MTPHTDGDYVGSPVGLIYLPGEDITPSQYVPLCNAIQSSFPQPLYVAIPQFLDGTPTIPELVRILPVVLREMENKGLPPNSSVFMAGHSLGGAALQGFSGIYQNNYTSIYPDWVYRGQMLNAAFLTHDQRDSDTQLISKNYTVPTLTLGGELDGCCRISRIIEQFYLQMIKNKVFRHCRVYIPVCSIYEHIEHETDPTQPLVNNQSVLQMPVITIYGMSHMQYASGPIPPAVFEHDLIPEINDSEAHRVAAEYMSCWMSLELKNGKCEFDMIYDGVMQSYPLALPLINAMILEGIHSHSVLIVLVTLSAVYRVILVRESV